MPPVRWSVDPFRRFGFVKNERLSGEASGCSFGRRKTNNTAQGVCTLTKKLTMIHSIHSIDSQLIRPPISRRDATSSPNFRFLDHSSGTMKIGCALLLLLSRVEAFAPTSPAHAAGSGSRSSSSALFDMPPAAIVKEGTVPELKPSPGGAPVAVRYSDFLKLVNGDRVEKVTFSADGTKLLGVDTDGTRIAIEALPNDPDLLTSLTSHKVRIDVCEVRESVKILLGKVREEICLN